MDGATPPTRYGSYLYIVKAGLDKAEAARAKAEANLRTADARHREYNTLLAEISNRKSRIQGNTHRLAGFKSIAANAQHNFDIELQHEMSNAPGHIDRFIQNLIVADKWIQLLPGWIKAEESALAKLEAQAVKMAIDYELN